MTTQILGYIANPEEMGKQNRIKRMEKAVYFLRQRILGIIALLVGIVALFITSEGIIASILLVPSGITLLISKEQMITDRTEDKHE